MEFETLKKETVLLNPLKNMERRPIPSEIRKDPLTGRTARICHFMKLSWPKPDFEQLTAGTEANCPFCPERIFQVTPHFPPEIIPEGRLTSEDMVLFPNLAPYDCLSAVASLGARHYIPMPEITADLISRGFSLAMTFFRRVRELNHPEAVYYLVNWNYMPVSGSSLIHPHLQVFASSSAPNIMREELAAAKRYQDQYGSNFWEDLIQSETKTGGRFLGKTGRTTWLSAYAPFGVAGDVLAVVDGASSTLDLTDQDLSDIGSGLTKAMAAYDDMGIYSFNLNFFTGAERDDHTRFHILFSPRTFFNPALGTPDIGALRNLYNETLCMAYPEDIAATLKPYFER